ncbi:MAG: plasmid pRiA4b ORF-3 family protein [Desulfotignum sp.]
MSDRFYLLKIKLLDIEPEIWRRFVVPSDISLDRLHDVIQIVMGWEDCHLHEFTIGKKRYTEYPESSQDGLVSGRYRLVDLIRQTGRTFGYIYDFGDGWEHELIIEDSRYADADRWADILCLDGERACPPEDVGGVPGYAEFSDIMSDPDHKEYAAFADWFGGHYDSDAFDPDYVNWELMKYLRWSRDRVLGWEKDD